MVNILTSFKYIGEKSENLKSRGIKNGLFSDLKKAMATAVMRSESMLIM